MGRMQRTKGQSGEREAAHEIRRHTGWEVHRMVLNPYLPSMPESCYHRCDDI